jgi:tetratricopeptide (TPR) repeat protein
VSNAFSDKDTTKNKPFHSRAQKSSFIETLDKKAENYISILDYQKAITAFKEILEIPNLSKKQKVLYYSKLGSIYEKLQNYDKSYDYYTVASDLAPKNLDIQIKIGEIYMQSNLYSLAENYFLQVLKKDRNSVRAMTGLGDSYFYRKLYEEAVEYYLKIPSSYYGKSLVLKIAICCEKLTKHEISLKIINDFIEKKAEFTRDIDLTFLKGLLYVGMNELDKAEKEFLVVLEQEQNRFQVYLNLANIYASRKNYYEAEKMLEKAGKLNPSNATIDLLIAENSYKLEKLNKSKVYADKAFVEADGEFVKKQAQRAVIFLNKKRPSKTWSFSTS